MGDTCALCEETKSEQFIVSQRGGGKVVCAQCLDELESNRSPIAGGVRAVNKKINTVANAAKKSVEAFKDELENE